MAGLPAIGCVAIDKAGAYAARHSVVVNDHEPILELIGQPRSNVIEEIVGDLCRDDFTGQSVGIDYMPQ